MSSISYDLDTSGGLMPLIRALIKPPDEDANSQKSKKPQHPYYKRPGKGHNHDSCDACGEGGELICCDRCPASFHYGCYDPPLDGNDIPSGIWLCKECRASDAQKPASSRSSRAQSPVDDVPRSLRNKKKSKDSNQDEKEDNKDKDKENDEEKRELTPMEILVNAARAMNPRQFELPREMQVVRMFPGMEKESSKNGNASVVTVDSSGCVPLPAKSCFVCTGTCKSAPLIQCDYCPLLFHQDCLDPPLTALPTGRWMCPNHVEQYIDWKLVNSVSASERVALWDQFSGPLDQHAIKLDFIRQARKVHPAFRMKVGVGVRGRVVVPGMVRHHYRQPPPLLPSRREYVRCLNALKTSPNPTDVDPDDVNETLPKHKICMNLECPMYDGGKCPHAATELQGATEKDAADDLQAINESKIDKSSDSDSLSDVDFESLSKVKRRRVSGGARYTPGAGGNRGRGGRVEFPQHEDAEALLAAVDDQLHKLDDRLVKLLAWQRLQQVARGGCAWGGGGGGGGVSCRLARAVRRSVDRAQLARYGFKHIALPSELLSTTDRDRIARAIWGSTLSGPQPCAGAGGPRAPQHSLTDCALRATLCAVLRPASNGLGDSLGRPIPMRLSALSVGSDTTCDVPLDPALCRRVSRRHATIFYDEVTRHFELINYSEWGSLVNGVMYTADPELAAPAPAPAPAPADGHDQHVLHARTVRNTQQGLNGTLSSRTRPRAILSSSPCACACAASPANSSGAWEGSAILPHGALLQFGCIMYVFSIADSIPDLHEQHL